MTNNQRTVDLVVRGRDQFSKVLSDLKKKFSDLNDPTFLNTNAGAIKRFYQETESQISKNESAIKRLRLEIQKLSAVEGGNAKDVATRAKEVGKLSREQDGLIRSNVKIQKSVLDMRVEWSKYSAERKNDVRIAQGIIQEAAATKKLVRETTELLRVKLANNVAVHSGFSAWERNVSLMQQETGFARQAAAALDKLNLSQRRVAAGGGAPMSRGGNSPMNRGDSGGRKGENQDVELYGLKPYQMVNLGYQVNDVVSGLAMGQAPIQILAQQAGQFAQIWPQMMVGLVRSIPQILAVTAVLAPFIAAFSRAQTEANSVKFFTSQLALMADGGLYSAESLAANAREMQKFGIAIEDARKISLAFIKDGQSTDSIGPLAQMAKQLSDVAGIDVGEAAAKLSEAFTGNIDDVRALDQELKFLTADQLANLRAMEASGQKVEALSEAQRILAGRLKDTVAPATEWDAALKDLTSAWDKLVSAIENSGIIDLGAQALGLLAYSAKGAAIIVNGAANTFGKAEETLSEQYGRLNKQRQELQRLIAAQQRADQAMFGENALDTSATTDLKKQLAELETQYEAVVKQIKEYKSVKDESTGTGVSATEEEKKLLLDVTDILNGQITALREEADLAALTSREQFIQNTLLDARNLALERANELGMEFNGLTAEQTRLLREQAGNSYDRGQSGTTLTSGMSGLVDKIIGVESGGNAAAKNPLSSATGLGQFISSTWLAMFKTYFPDRAAGMTEAAILALREDAAISRQMVELYARENAAVLQKAGIATTDAALYLAHFLGPQGAAGIMAAQASTPVSDILGAGQINSNKSILEGKTASEVVAWAEKKMGISQNEMAVNERLAELDAERVKNEEDYLKNYRQRIEGQQFELSAATLEARQAAVSKALREEELAAQQAGLSLTKEQRAEIERTAGALFDRQNVEMEVNRLLEQRSLLLESLDLAQQAGDSGQVTQIVGEINATELSLQSAIDDAIAFWQAIGGPGADAAILKLQNLRGGIGDVIEDLETNFLPTAESINERLADIGSNAFSAMAEAIANGTNVAQAFFQTLMQGIGEFIVEIGKAIVKQALFNAISGGGGGDGKSAGGFLSGLIGNLFHSGGVVGRSGGSGSRMVNPGIFAGAQRFHAGGVLGLGPNEVPIIGLKDEEMLTRDDPRHVLNGGASGSQVNVKNVNVFDPVDVLEAALNTEVGERVMVNFMTRRSRQISGALNA